jgi:hypothetical protein
MTTIKLAFRGEHRSSSESNHEIDGEVISRILEKMYYFRPPADGPQVEFFNEINDPDLLSSLETFKPIHPDIEVGRIDVVFKPHKRFQINVKERMLDYYYTVYSKTLTVTDNSLQASEEGKIIAVCTQHTNPTLLVLKLDPQNDTGITVEVE